MLILAVNALAVNVLAVTTVSHGVYDIFSVFVHVS